MAAPEPITPAPTSAKAEGEATIPPAIAKPPGIAAGAKRRLVRGIGAVFFLALLLAGGCGLIESWGTVSTDDAYVNGHVTFVAPRVAGQVTRVLVEDNNRVHRGDLLVQIDPEPCQVQVDIAAAQVAAAQADLVLIQAQTRAAEAQARSLRFSLEHAIEDADNQVSLLRSKVANLASQTATMDQAQADFDRDSKLVGSGALSQQEWERSNEALRVAKAKVEESLQEVYQIRVGLGLPPKPESGDDLAQVPADFDQTVSTVKLAQASLMQAAAPLGVSDSFNKSPKELVADFYKRDPQGDIDRIYAQLLENAPAVKQSEAKLALARSQLLAAQLNLRYCSVIADIDGVVTRRSVNPGNNVVAGQSLMAVRSLTEIWVDANFKETQLARLRIGQAVDLEVDMYGRHQKFPGRISGFTMGTGSTLALLPSENATGNFVKVVQRLPVRIELSNYDPEKMPLFAGLSVTPVVHLREPPTGPDAGQVLQPYLAPSPAVTAVGP
jgi:membrane fusion protein (multidrug efflux system)